MPEDPQLNLLMQVIDFVLPALTPYEFSLYVLLLRRSHLSTGTAQVQIGKRTLAELFGQGTQSAKPQLPTGFGCFEEAESKGVYRCGTDHARRNNLPSSPAAGDS